MSDSKMQETMVVVEEAQAETVAEAVAESKPKGKGKGKGNQPKVTTASTATFKVKVGDGKPVEVSYEAAAVSIPGEPKTLAEAFENVINAKNTSKRRAAMVASLYRGLVQGNWMAATSGLRGKKGVATLTDLPTDNTFPAPRLIMHENASFSALKWAEQLGDVDGKFLVGLVRGLVDAKFLAEPKAKDKPEPKAKAKTETKATAKTTTTKGKAKTETKAEPKAEAVAEPESKAEAVAEPVVEKKTTPQERAAALAEKERQAMKERAKAAVAAAKAAQSNTGA